jgi:hypothetical protein
VCVCTFCACVKVYLYYVQRILTEDRRCSCPRHSNCKSVPAPATPCVLLVCSVVKCVPLFAFVCVCVNG